MLKLIFSIFDYKLKSKNINQSGDKSRKSSGYKSESKSATIFEKNSINKLILVGKKRILAKTIVNKWFGYLISQIDFKVKYF